MSLQGISPGNSWLAGFSLKDYKNIQNIKMRKLKAEYYLETLIAVWIKWIGMVKAKEKDFTDAVSVMPYQISL